MTASGTRRLARRILPAETRARGWTRPLARFIEAIARFGYVARGLVYMSVGGLSLLAALAPARRAEGPVGALQTWTHWPLGVFLLCAIALGLLAMATWRFLQAALDADRVGDTPDALMRRAGKAGEGVVDVGMALSILHVVLALSGRADLDDQARAQGLAQRLLALPGGGAVLIAVGAGVAASGVSNMWRAATGRFTQDLDCDGPHAFLAGLVGRLGLFSRGFALVAVGGLTALAGWQARPDYARGFGGALEALKDQPVGPLLLAALGIGFLAYGLFSFAKALLRRIGR
ncbi:MAG: DUF1206 domain-containing protein [Phenylobacterium zucineum]|nr:MAG: DUF1206 domain-containing protein [Phenylobacterium zucineum]